MEARGYHKQHLSCTTFCNCHGGQNCLNQFTATSEIEQSAEEETEANYIDSNLLDDCDDGFEQDNEDGGVPDDPILDCLDEWQYRYRNKIDILLYKKMLFIL